MDSINRKTLVEPKIFESGSDQDPEEWLERFELLAKLNGWIEQDQITLIQLYLGRKENVWYKKNKNKFILWTNLREEFMIAFKDKDLEMIAWNKIQKIKQKDFLTIEDLELELEYLFLKANINEDLVKFNCLMASLEIKSKRKVLESGIKGWRSTISKLKDVERVNRLLDDTKHSYVSDSPKEETDSRKIVKIHPEIESGEPMFEALNRRFEKLSLNLISKIDDVANKIETNLNRNKALPAFQGNYNKPYCVFCKKEGHRRFECPEYSSYVNAENRKNQNVGSHKINSLEFFDIEDESDRKYEDIYVVDKRTLDVSEESKNLKKSKMNPENVELEEMAKQRTKIRRKLIPKMAENTEPYSLLNELQNTYPKINLVQLISASPSLRNELVGLCKKVEEKEVSQLDVSSSKITNCKAIVNIFGSYCWAVVDTGAACSVVSNSLLEKWGIEPDIRTNQLVVTADGAKHETNGKVSQVPIIIAGYKFPISLVVMDRKDDFLVLGTDWFIEHKAKIDMQSQELTLPVKNAEVIISLSTKSKDKFLEDVEIYTIYKEENIDQSSENIILDDRLDKLIENNKQLFVDEIEELTQTDLVEHKIELSENNPIKQRPYRIPYHLQNMVERKLST
ncbi:hypothetical protein AYI69_g5967 [Smittium culicis]|uniref:CCHC-type domain-containing protein n=1 Tax=Smittium culicis TaxID=133412 RepID=A0A1R1Y2I7_9FUNG|nr:hypothetical protein AYI69_g5967 [Smittium culicis]